jgi:hypothetical protein
MRIASIFCLAGLMPSLLLAQARLTARPAGEARQGGSALPDIRQLLLEVQEHQKQLEKVRENYTYTSLQTTQDIDANGQVKKTETLEGEDFFVNGHVIERTVKKNGQPLNSHEEQKETGRVTKLVEKAEKLLPDQPLQGPGITVSRLLEIMDVRNPRRENYRGRPAIVFEFIGRKDAKTHGLMEDASKKLEGTVWIDEADRQVAHMEVSFNDNFRVAGGLLATIQRGSSFHFDQAPVNHPNAKDPSLGTPVSHPNAKDPSLGTPVNEELWLPTGGEGTMTARVLMVKGLRQHFTERDYDYKRFRVEIEQRKDAKVVPGKTK